MIKEDSQEQAGRRSTGGVGLLRGKCTRHYEPSLCCRGFWVLGESVREVTSQVESIDEMMISLKNRVCILSPLCAQAKGMPGQPSYSTSKFSLLDRLVPTGS